MSKKRKAKLTGRTRAPYKTRAVVQTVPANPFAVAAIRFLLLTGWRMSEALTLKWSDLNLDRGTATLLDTKTGRSHRVIGADALAVLATLPREGAHVFPGRVVGKPLVEINRVWYAVRAAANLDDLRLHDLRHAFASVGAQRGDSLLVIGALLGHRDLTTTSKYAHLSHDPLRVAADASSSTLAGWMAGEGAT